MGDTTLCQMYYNIYIYILYLDELPETSRPVRSGNHHIYIYIHTFLPGDISSRTREVQQRRHWGAISICRPVFCWSPSQSLVSALKACWLGSCPWVRFVELSLLSFAQCLSQNRQRLRFWRARCALNKNRSEMSTLCRFCASSLLQISSTNFFTASPMGVRRELGTRNWSTVVFFCVCVSLWSPQNWKGMTHVLVSQSRPKLTEDGEWREIPSIRI